MLIKAVQNHNLEGGFSQSRALLEGIPAVVPKEARDIFW
jgi:hypothetical protein